MKRHALLAIFLPLLLWTGLPAQFDKHGKLIPPKITRKTEQGEDGKQVWAQHEHINCPYCKATKTMKCPQCNETERLEECPECDNKKTAPCRGCAGEGKLPDPLEWVRCGGCLGAGHFPCYLCNREGSMKIEGGGKRAQKCSGCKGRGAYTCTVCKGKRKIASMPLKPSLAEAPLKKLQQAKEAVDEALANLKAIKLIGNTSKDTRAYTKAIAPLRRLSREFGKASKMFKDIHKGICTGDRFVENNRRKEAFFKAFLQHNTYYLLHQQQTLALCIQRQEANARLDKK